VRYKGGGTAHGERTASHGGRRRAAVHRPCCALGLRRGDSASACRT